MRVACAILFLVFTFVFLYIYGGDMLVIEQHLASGGATHYEYLIGAVLLTVFLFLVQVGAAAIARLHGIFYAFTYFPSLFILTILTDTPSTVTDAPAGNAWMWQVPIMLVLWGVAVYMARRYQRVEVETRHVGLFNQLSFVNLLTLGMLMLIPCSFSNHDAPFHKRIHQEYLITHGRFTEALEEGRAMRLQDKRQTMVNAYCLMRQCSLADSLFSLDIPRGMITLSPGKENGHFYLLHDTTVWKETKSYRNVLLCNRLLRRDLSHFSARLRNWYQRKTHLPVHFREAIALCREHEPQLVNDYPPEAMDTILLNFQRLRLNNQQDSLRLLYAHTFWYYYYFSK